MERIGIAGTGRMAQALGRLLHDRGMRVAAVAGRDPGRTLAAASFISAAAGFIDKDVLAVGYSELPGHADHILICVPDDALEGAAKLLAASPGAVRAAIHTCGSRGPEALSPLQALGADCAALHPLQTIATPMQGLADLPGSSFGVTGSGLALDWALEIVRLLDGHALTIAPESRALYHAAAVMASNYVVATIDAAVILMGLAGVAPEPALQALAPLVRASVENALNSGPVEALTGPIERGDERTVAAHLHALDNAPESVRQLYRHAGLHALGIARRKTPAVERGAIEFRMRQS